MTYEIRIRITVEGRLYRHNYDTMYSEEQQFNIELTIDQAKALQQKLQGALKELGNNR